MLGRIIVPKYLDLGRLVIGVHITEILDQNTLIFTGDVINIVTKNAMLNSIFKIPWEKPPICFNLPMDQQWNQRKW